jgi:division protein 1
VFSIARAGNPRELIRSKFSHSEIEHRALSYLPDELLRNVPERRSTFSLLDGFKASLPTTDDDVDAAISGKKKAHGRRNSKGQKLLIAVEEEEKGPAKLVKCKRDRDRLEHKLEMMGVRKTMCASEIREIDEKIANLNTMRKVILERLAGLEDEERDMEHELGIAMDRLDTVQEELDDEVALASKSPALGAVREESPAVEDVPVESIESSTASLPQSGQTRTPAVTPKSKRKRVARKVSTPVLHEVMESGSQIRELQAHTDSITALDFDTPFGTMVTASLDDTVRVWDLNAGRCMGILEGHLSSVRCLQVEDNIVATGSMDATIRLWDLNNADYTPPISSSINSNNDDPDAPSSGEDLYSTPDGSSVPSDPSPNTYRADAMSDCHMYTLTSHVAEITALHFRGSTLVSGSADKTLRQWDLEKGRCVQTLDVLWAAAQASTINTNVNGAPPSAFSPSFSNSTAGGGNWWRPTTGRMQSAEADFVGAVQVFDAALACGTADGMVRLWDLRSGMVHRSLVGHTGPITALQFDDVFLVTGSHDRSVRVSSPSCSSHVHPFSKFICPVLPCTSTNLHNRSGISAPETSMTLLATTRPSHRYNSTPAASSPPLEKMWSRSTIKPRGDSGIAVIRRTIRRLSNMFASRMGISVKEGKMVLSGCGVVNDCVLRCEMMGLSRECR